MIMKKILIAMMAFATLFAVSCNKDDEEENATLQGRWDAPHSADDMGDIAFVALFGDENLDLYIIPWGQHMKGTYSMNNGVITYNITEAYQAYTDVSYDGKGNMTSWSWMAGNLDATTLTLAEGYNWYAMNGENFNQAQEDFGEFEFNIKGSTAKSTLVGLPDLTFYKK